MSMTYRIRWIATIILLLILSPLFGVILADMVGYREPLDIVAGILGLTDSTEDINWTPFLDYNVPGLPGWIGYIVSGFIGITSVVCLGLLLEKLLKGGVKRRAT